MSRRNVTTKEVEQNVQYLLDNMNGEGGNGGNGGNPFEVKTLSYTGVGGREHTIDFGETIHAILCIRGMGSDNHPIIQTFPLFAVDDGIMYSDVTWWGSGYSGVGGHVGNEGMFEDDNTKYHIIRGSDDGACFNLANAEYTVYYI